MAKVWSVSQYSSSSSQVCVRLCVDSCHHIRHSFSHSALYSMNNEIVEWKWKTLIEYLMSSFRDWNWTVLASLCTSARASRWSGHSDKEHTHKRAQIRRIRIHRRRERACSRKNKPTSHRRCCLWRSWWSCSSFIRSSQLKWTMRFVNVNLWWCNESMMSNRPQSHLNTIYLHFHKRLDTIQRPFCSNWIYLFEMKPKKKCAKREVHKLVSFVIFSFSGGFKVKLSVE